METINNLGQTIDNRLIDPAVNNMSTVSYNQIISEALNFKIILLNVS